MEKIKNMYFSWIGDENYAAGCTGLILELEDGQWMRLMGNPNAVGFEPFTPDNHTQNV